MKMILVFCSLADTCTNYVFFPPGDFDAKTLCSEDVKTTTMFFSGLESFRLNDFLLNSLAIPLSKA